MTLTWHIRYACRRSIWLSRSILSLRDRLGYLQAASNWICMRLCLKAPTTHLLPQCLLCVWIAGTFRDQWMPFKPQALQSWQYCTIICYEGMLVSSKNTPLATSTGVCLRRSTICKACDWQLARYSAVSEWPCRHCIIWLSNIGLELTKTHSIHSWEPFAGHADWGSWWDYQVLMISGGLGLIYCSYDCCSAHIAWCLPVRNASGQISV